MHDPNATCKDAVFRLDEAEILARLDGDCQLLAELCDMALTEIPRMIETLAEAVRVEDANAVHRSAHRLKGSLSIFGAGPHIEISQALEDMALNRDLLRAPEVFGRLEIHLLKFTAAVAALGKESHARANRR
jgi:protein-histidine pros-kinase